MGEISLQEIINEAKLREDKQYCEQMRKKRINNKSIWNNLSEEYKKLLVSITNMNDED